MQYGMVFDEKRADDLTGEFYGVSVLIDPFSADYLRGAVVDFVDATGGYQYLLYAPDNRPFSPAESSIRPFDMAMNSANIGRLADVAKYIAAKAAQFVSVQMKLPRALDKPDRLSLHVVDASGRPLNSVHLAYPRELLPCSGP